MRLGHIIVSVHKASVIADLIRNLKYPSCVHEKSSYALRFCIVLNASDHSGEVIPVPIPNTEVKLSYVDDTAFAVGK